MHKYSILIPTCKVTGIWKVTQALAHPYQEILTGAALQVSLDTVLGLQSHHGAGLPCATQRPPSASHISTTDRPLLHDITITFKQITSRFSHFHTCTEPTSARVKRWPPTRDGFSSPSWQPSVTTSSPATDEALLMSSSVPTGQCSQGAARAAGQLSLLRLPPTAGG